MDVKPVIGEVDASLVVVLASRWAMCVTTIPEIVYMAAPVMSFILQCVFSVLKTAWEAVMTKVTRYFYSFVGFNINTVRVIRRLSSFCGG